MVSDRDYMKGDRLKVFKEALGCNSWSELIGAVREVVLRQIQAEKVSSADLALAQSIVNTVYQLTIAAGNARALDRDADSERDVE